MKQWRTMALAFAILFSGCLSSPSDEGPGSLPVESCLPGPDPRRGEQGETTRCPEELTTTDCRYSPHLFLAGNTPGDQLVPEGYNTSNGRLGWTNLTIAACESATRRNQTISEPFHFALLYVGVNYGGPEYPAYLVEVYTDEPTLMEFFPLGDIEPQQATITYDPPLSATIDTPDAEFRFAVAGEPETPSLSSNSPSIFYFLRGEPESPTVIRYAIEPTRRSSLLYPSLLTGSNPIILEAPIPAFSVTSEIRGSGTFTIHPTS